MTARTGEGTRPRFLCVLVGISLLYLVGAPEPAESQETSPRPPQSGLVVFVSYQGTVPLAIEPTRMRVAGSRALAGAMEAYGHRVVTYPALERIMRRWRVRSEHDLGTGFLGDLVSEFGIDRLVVVRLDVYPDRLIVLARGLTASTGRLIAAEVVEETSDDLWGDREDARGNWMGVVARAGHQLGAQWREFEQTPGEDTLVVLPMQPVGVGTGHSEVAAHCLLRSLLEQGQWVLPDPSLVRTALLEAGHHPRQLTPEVRQTIRGRFSAGAVLISRLVSFGQTERARTEYFDDDDAMTQVPYQLETRVPVHLSLLLVDSGTGSVRAGSGVYLEPENPTGLFGIMRDVRAASRLRKGTDQLVERILPRKGKDS